MLEDIKKTYMSIAYTLTDFEPNPKRRNADINYLANKYIEAENNNDDITMNKYFSALVLRYWFAIGKYYETSKNTFSIDDCYEWLIHALTYALEHRSWLDPNSSLYGDPNGADKVINRCIASTRLINYQSTNTDKTRLNYGLASLDNLVDENGDCTIKDSEFVEEQTHDASDSIVQALINKNKVVEALIIDGICKQDVFVETSAKEKTPEYSYIDYDDDGNEVTVKGGGEVYNKSSQEFSSKKLVKHLNNLDSKFLLYFAKEYEIEDVSLQKGVDKIKALKGQKLYNYIAKTLNELKDDADIKSMLCL